jgi:hypothetical protein
MYANNSPERTTMDNDDTIILTPEEKDKILTETSEESNQDDSAEVED